MLLERLSNTPDANRQFSEWYRRNNWRYNLPLEELLSEENMGFQSAPFIDFLASKNIGTIVTPKGYTLYIIKKEFMSERDKEMVDEGFHLLICDTGYGWISFEANVEIPEKYSKSPATIINYITELAVASAMQLLQNKPDGFGKE
jgi:hypothetical protein